MLIDTDVLIWAARGYPAAIEALDAIERPRLSVVSVIELMQGARNKKELSAQDQRLRQWGPQVIDLDPGISAQAVELIREYAHARGLRLADALIAATAMVRDLSLVSGNHKHYRDLPGLRFQPFSM